MKQKQGDNTLKQDEGSHKLERVYIQSNYHKTANCKLGYCDVIKPKFVAASSEQWLLWCHQAKVCRCLIRTEWTRLMRGRRNISWVVTSLIGFEFWNFYTWFHEQSMNLLRDIKCFYCFKIIKLYQKTLETPAEVNLNVNTSSMTLI